MSKPIIRHCRNCKYSVHHAITDNVYCDVRYKLFFKSVQRIKAIFCRFYKEKGGAE